MVVVASHRDSLLQQSAKNMLISLAYRSYGQRIQACEMCKERQREKSMDGFCYGSIGLLSPCQTQEPGNIYYETPYCAVQNDSVV